MTTINLSGLLNNTYQGNIGYTGSIGTPGVYGWITKTANYTALNLDAIIADTSGGAFTITLPATPAAGDTVIISDGDNFSTNNLTVARNGSTIEGIADDFVLDIQHVKIDFVYDGSTWQVFPTISAANQPAIEVENVGNITSSTLDLSTGNVFEYTPSDNTTFIFDNPPISGSAQGFTLKVTGAILEYSFDLANASSDAVKRGEFSVSAQDTVATGVFFKPDGLKMYVIGSTGDSVYEYNLSTAWDVSSASFLQNFSVAAQDIAPTGVFFKPDGTKMYVVGEAEDAVYEYNLSTAWDVSSASYLQNFSVAAQQTNPQGVFFKPDGTKMYIVGSSGVDVNEYNLSTAWDVSTASYLQNFSPVAQETNPQGVFFKPDGLKMYVIGSTGDSVYGYSLSTAWDVSSASWDAPLEGYFSVYAQETRPTGVFFKPDGTKMYIIGYSGDNVNEYDLSTAWDITTASYLQNFSVSAQDTTPYGLFFKSDGFKMYMLGSGRNISEYNLSTAWDVSTASYLQNFSVASQELNPRGFFFKPDGTKMYVVGLSGDDVNEYDLSTAWDITTASYLQNFSVAAQETSPQGVFFKPDGTKMYIIGSSGVDVNEYNLSTAWDVSTASYLQNFSVAAQETMPYGLFFKPDGLKMYIVGEAEDAVFQYTTGALPTPATFTYPASVKWPGGTAPDAPADGEIDILTFYTEDGGATYYGFKAGDNML